MKRKVVCALAGLLCGVTPSRPGFAQGDAQGQQQVTEPATEAQQQAAEPETEAQQQAGRGTEAQQQAAEQKVERDKNTDFFSNLGLAVGISFDDRGAHRVTNAELDNSGLVRVTEDNDVLPRILLEYHVTLVCKREPLLDASGRPLPRLVFGRRQSDTEREASSTGPDLQSGRRVVTEYVKAPCSRNHKSQGIFFALQSGSENVIDAMGMGWMWRLPDKLQLKNRALNLGIGYLVDRKVKTLADGIEPNRPLPSGDTEIRYRTTNVGGFVIIASIEVGESD